jgi:hypothetical protein
LLFSRLLSSGLPKFGKKPTLTNRSYSGDFTIKLSSGLSVRIPNNQLIVPERVVSPSGDIIANGSSPNLVINVIKEININDQLHLGRQFLSAAYVMLNEDTSSFTLWQANPTMKESLVAVDGRNNPLWSNCSVNQPDGTSRGSRTVKLSAGAIAGTVVGATLAVLAIAAGAFFILKNRKKKRASLVNPAGDKEPIEMGPGYRVDQKKTWTYVEDTGSDAFSPRPSELGIDNEHEHRVELPATNHDPGKDEKR